MSTERVIPESIRTMPIGLLRQNVAVAREALGLRLQTDSEQELLHEYQVDVLQAIYTALGNGIDAGHIDEATGVGKTAIGLQVAEALTPILAKDGHGKTLFISPTIPILLQTKRSAEQFAEGISVSNFYSDEHDITGDIVNTTYRSLPQLLQVLFANAQDVRLAICDEVHTGQGEVTTAAFPAMPNAILLGLSATPDDRTIQRLIREEKLTGEERWIKMFQTKIHEIDLSEGVARGILSKVDISVVATSFDARGITVESTGEYNQAQLERFLRNRSRMMMAVAMVVGLDRMTDVSFSADLQAQIVREHERIKGKQTLIFGHTTDFADELRDVLLSYGVAAASYHSKIPQGKRIETEGAFGTGDLTVLTGVKSLGIGIDMPDATVGIFLYPRHSASDVEQELGRILRVARGKETAIAIQPLDEFDLGNGPVLIPELFDPETVQRSLRTRYASRRTAGEKTEGRAVAPRITFSGMHIDAVFRHIRVDRAVKSQLESAKDIAELDEVLQAIIADTMSRLPHASISEQYAAIAQALPEHLPIAVGQLVHAAAMDDDERGVSALVFLNLKTILSVVKRYENEGNPEELLQEAVLALIQSYPQIDTKYRLSQQAYRIVNEALSQYIADNAMVNVGWVRQNKYDSIRSIVDRTLQVNPALGKDAQLDLVEEIVENVSGDLAASSLLDYIEARIGTRDWEEEYRQANAQGSHVDTKTVDQVLETYLTPRERLVIRLRFGFDGDALSLEAVGKHLGVTRERVRSIEANALIKLRHPHPIRELRAAF